MDQINGGSSPLTLPALYETLCKSEEALMETAFKSPSPFSSSLNNESRSLISSSNSPMVSSPFSEKRFWSALRSRFDVLTDNPNPIDKFLPAQMKAEAMEQARRLKQDWKLLLRGFDATAHSISQLSNNLDTALQGGRDLARPPRFTEILEATIGKAKFEVNRVQHNGEDNNQLDKRGLKRKLDSRTSTDSDRRGGGNSHDVTGPYEFGKLKKAKNLATSMATNAVNVAREVKSVRTELEFMKERCALLEEENSKLLHELAEGIRPDNDDDDLVRLQLEALLAEKSRLANANANLMRENQRLHQLVEYHLLTTHDLSTSYDNMVRETGPDYCTSETEGGSHGRSALKTPYILGFMDD